MLRIATCLALACFSVNAIADASLPTADPTGSQDPAGLGRYEGSFIVDYQTKAYDELSLPVSTLKASADEDARDGRNNRVFAADSTLNLEGRLSRVVYLLPEGRSSLEVLRNYQEIIAAKGGKTLHECKAEACGGDVTSGADHGGGEQGILSQLFPADRVAAESFSNAACAVTMQTSDVRYFVARYDAGGIDTHVAIYTYTARDDLYCKAFNDRTVAIVVTLEAKPREQNMVVVKASAMAEAIAGSGKVSLYGITFDFDKATLKAESAAQIEQIAGLMKQDAALKLMVVGHTDNQGGAAYNLDLSKRRADTVVTSLTALHGIAADRLLAQGMGSAAPLASNDDEAGRSKNRRVELVKQ